MCVAAGEPGSKPFPEFVPLKPAEAVTAASPTLQLAQAEVRQDGGSKKKVAGVKGEKISPVKRTRFRARDSRKIVLKRRKVKRLRARPRPAPAPSDSSDSQAQGLAPEAHRGGSLAELALATLSQEEVAEEARAPGARNRDIMIMKGPTLSTSREKFLTFPTTRLKTALLLKDKTVREDNKSIQSNTNAIKIRNKLFDPRKRTKGIKTPVKTALRERLRNPDSSKESSPLLLSPFPEEQPVSPFPNFPMIDSVPNSIDSDTAEEVREGRVIESEIPNIGFEELKLTPQQQQSQEQEQEAETFLPVLSSRETGRQEFPAVSAVPATAADVATTLGPTTTAATPAPAPVRGQPLPVSTFFEYTDPDPAPDSPPPSRLIKIRLTS